MELVSKMAQGWIDFRLLSIKKAVNFNDLNHYSASAMGDIELLYREELIDYDEREWATKVINDATNQRATKLTSNKPS